MHTVSLSLSPRTLSLSLRSIPLHAAAAAVVPPLTAGQFMRVTPRSYKETKNLPKVGGCKLLDPGLKAMLGIELMKEKLCSLST